MAAAKAGESREVKSYRDKQQYKKMDNRYGEHHKVEENNFRSKEKYLKSGENGKNADGRPMQNDGNNKPGERGTGYNSNMSKNNGNIPKDNLNNPKEALYKNRENFGNGNDKYRTKDNFNSGDNTRSPRNGYRQGNSDYRPKDSGYKPAGSNAWKGNNFTGHKKSPGYLADKDDEEDTRAVKGRRQSDSKARTQNKDSELVTDKLETMKRLEREKKAVQKKSHEEEVIRRGRPAVKQKREVKDWTKGYEAGIIDE